METTTINANGTQLYCETTGDGQPVIFLHDMALDCRMWEPQFAALADQCKLVRYDARGYGKSASPDGEAFSHAEDLHALIEAMGLSKPVLVGASMGGQTALEYAIRYPDNVAALILSSPMLQDWEYSDAGKAIFAAVADAVKSGGADAAKQAWLDSALFDKTRQNADIAASLQQMVGDYSGYYFVNDAQLKGIEPSMLEQLSSIKVPVLVVCGQDEWPDSNAVREAIAEKVWHNKTMLLQGIGHLANMEDVEGFNEMIREFIKMMNSWS